MERHGLLQGTVESRRRASEGGVHADSRQLVRGRFRRQFVAWPKAKIYTAERVRPDGNYLASDFNGSEFIWTDDLDLDNTVNFRYTEATVEREVRH